MFAMSVSRTTEFRVTLCMRLKIGVDIRAVPLVKQQHNPKFILECTRALELCSNMMSFRCSTNSLPPFIPSLQQKDRLRDLRIHADLTTEQSMEVARLSKIRHLTLEFASWNLVNLLPQWSASLHGNLTTLTLYVSPSPDLRCYLLTNSRWHRN